MLELAATAASPGPPLSAGVPSRWAVTQALLARSGRLSLRNVEALITALALPVMLMVMFVYLFEGAIDTGTRYVEYVVPGVLLVCVGFGASTTAVTVAGDLASGAIDRFRSIDVHPRALVGSHVVASVGRNLASTAVVFAVAFAIGFRSSASPGQWLAAVGLLALFVLGLSWLAAAVGVMIRSPEGANGVMFIVAFLPYPSSAFVPVATMPRWLQGFARYQPVSEVIDAIRHFLLGGPPGNHVAASVIWSLAIAMAGALAAGTLFDHRMRKA